MKIAHVIPQFGLGFGGLETCVHNLAARHQALGHQVHVYCSYPEKLTFTPTYAVRKLLTPPKITQTYPLSKMLIQGFVRLRQGAERYDLWQINGGYPYGAFLAGYFHRAGLPAVLRCSGDDIQTSPELDYGVRRNPKINGIVTASYPAYPALVAITETVRREYLALGVPEERIALIPNGVDAARLAEGRDGGATRRARGVPETAALLLTVGRNHPKKNYAAIPSMLASLLDQGRDVYWMAVGRGTSLLAHGEKGDFGGRLICVEEIGSSGSAFEIPSDAVLDCYKAADVFVMPSLLETFGIVIIEAMAAGLPVVCFDVPGVRDVAPPGIASVCPAGDAAAMVAAIGETLDRRRSPEKEDEARAYVRDYDWDFVAARYMELYRRLTGRPAGGR